MTIFQATDLTEGEATPMEDERIETWPVHSIRKYSCSGPAVG